MSGYTLDDFIESTGEDGHKILKFETDSNMLSVEQPDLYTSYTGDSETEGFLENQESEHGLPSDYDAYDWTYDNAAVIKALGEAGVEDVINQLGSDGIVLSAEVTGTYSPREYNFATDSYKAVWEFDATALDAWCKENNFDPDAYARLHHGSHSGFMSFVDMWLEDLSTREGTIQWLKFDAYLRAELDLEKQTYAMAEAESEAWSQNTTAVLKTESE